MNSKSITAFNDELTKVGFMGPSTLATKLFTSLRNAREVGLEYRRFLRAGGKMPFSDFKAEIKPLIGQAREAKTQTLLGATQKKYINLAKNPEPTFYDKHKKKLILGGAAAAGGYYFLNKDSKKSQEEELQEAYAKLQQAGYLK